MSADVETPIADQAQIEASNNEQPAIVTEAVAEPGAYAAAVTNEPASA